MASPAYVEMEYDDIFDLNGTFSTLDVVEFHWHLIQRPQNSNAVVLEAFFDPMNPALGGFPDNTATANAVLHVDEPGRYVAKLVVVDGDGNIAPSHDCPSHAYTVIEAKATMPVIANGAACDRDGSTNRCNNLITCAQTAVDGTGSCTRLWRATVETEPNQVSAAAIPTSVGPGRAYFAAVDPIGADPYDVFRVTLGAPTRIAIETSNVHGVCDADTRLFRIDPAILNTLGYPAAIAAGNRYNWNEDGGVGLCSRLLLNLGAGTHYFLVDEHGADHRASYAFRIVPLKILADRCDAYWRESYCAVGTSCVDGDFNGDGTCN